MNMRPRPPCCSEHHPVGWRERRRHAWHSRSCRTCDYVEQLQPLLVGDRQCWAWQHVRFVQGVNGMLRVQR